MSGHVFICYSRKDESFVFKLATNLKDRGIPIWLDQWDIPLGDNWSKTIDKALSECAYLLVVLSPASVDSIEVQSEWLKALHEKKIIVPIIYQSCSIPRQLFLFQHADFTSCSADDENALRDVSRALGFEASTSPTIAEKMPPKDKDLAQVKPLAVGMDKYVCTSCGYIYDPAIGDSAQKIKPVNTEINQLVADVIEAEMDYAHSRYSVKFDQLCDMNLGDIMSFKRCLSAILRKEQDINYKPQLKEMIRKRGESPTGLFNLISGRR